MERRQPHGLRLLLRALHGRFHGVAAELIHGRRTEGGVQHQRGLELPRLAARAADCGRALRA